MSLSIQPGRIALHRIPCRACSTAIPFIIAISAPFDPP